MTLVEFLKARLAEDQRHAEKDIWAANRATVGDWIAFYGTNLPTSEIRVDQQRVALLESPFHEMDALLVGRFKPSTVRNRGKKVLREVEAKRRIIDLHQEGVPNDLPRDQEPTADEILCMVCTAVGDPPYCPCSTLRLLAQPYADHGDYRAEWAI